MQQWEYIEFRIERQNYRYSVSQVNHEKIKKVALHLFLNQLGRDRHSQAS
jgi:hypothetical protein